MDIPDALRSLLADGSDPDSGVDPEARAARLDGGRIVTRGGEQIAIDVPDDADVDAERIEAALNGQAGGFDVRGQAGGDTTVTPVASGRDIHITDSAFDLSDWEYSAFLDDQITNLIETRVDYNTDTGKWILANDDLIPGILIRLKSLMLGRDGLDVQPADPDTEADQRLADHMDAIYTGDPSVDTHVDPSKVLDRVLEQNLLNAVYVGRSTDLQHLDVDDLSYVKDGETGDEIYIQAQTSYTTFDLDDDSGEPDVSVEHTDDRRALEIGTEVLDVRMYRTPPLQAIADDAVNKMQLKRLQGRKAEIASIGGVIIKVNPPAWLVEEDYDQYVDAADSQFGDESGRLLELVMAQQIDAALETLEEYQTATVMAVPENWETETIELPEMDESMSSMIRDYNEAISRRLLLPLDLIELKEGPELSRHSMMQLFLDQISGWQGQVTDLFDKFAGVQAEIHGLDGSVVHELPAIAAEDEQEILQLFNYAGLLGMSEAEGRELANTLEGVDLETDPTRGMPPEGGPESPEDREQAMDEFLDQEPGNQENGQNQGPSVGDDAHEPRASADDSTITRREVLASLGLDDDDDDELDVEADGYPVDPEVWPHRAARAAWDNVGQSMDTCMAHMVTEAGWDDRKAEAFCAGLRDSLHEQSPLSQFQTEAGGVSKRLKADFDPSEHVRDEEGKFTEIPASGMIRRLSRIARDVHKAGEPDEDTTVIHFDGDVPSSRDIQSALVYDEASGRYDEGAVRLGVIDIINEDEVGGNAQELAQSDFRDIFTDTNPPDGVEADIGDFRKPALHIRVTEPVDADGFNEFLSRITEKVNQRFYPYDPTKQNSDVMNATAVAEAVERLRRTGESDHDGELAATGSYSEGDEVDTPEGVGVVVEVRTEEFDGPDGETIDATSDDPAYIVGVETGVEVYRESDLSSGEIDPDVENPEGELDVDDDAEGSRASVEAIRGDGRFQIPESWEESETPNRLILLKAWAGMGGQFDCPSGDCCKGTMIENGMNPKAANRFCAAMKDRTLGGWEGWRKGAAADSGVEADWDPDVHPRGPDGKFVEQPLDTLPIDVDLDQFDQSQTESIRSALKEMEAQGLLENVDRFTGSVAQDPGDSSAATYDPGSSVMWLDQRYTDKNTAGMQSIGQWVSGDLATLIRHETVHAEHYRQAGVMRAERLAASDLTPSEQDLMAEQVSEYAASTPLEAVAEIGAMKLRGDDIPDDVERVYEKYDGPEL
jgi:hypothetical protein